MGIMVTIRLILIFILTLAAASAVSLQWPNQLTGLFVTTMHTEIALELMVLIWSAAAGLSIYLAYKLRFTGLSGPFLISVPWAIYYIYLWLDLWPSIEVQLAYARLIAFFTALTFIQGFRLLNQVSASKKEAEEILNGANRESALDAIDNDSRSSDDDSGSKRS